MSSILLPKQEHYDLLAKAYQRATTGSTDGWEDQGFDDFGEAYGAADDITITREPLSAFDGSTWREASGRQDFTIDGFACLHWAAAQASKGQQRRSLTIVDLGGLRLCYQV